MQETEKNDMDLTAIVMMHIFLPLHVCMHLQDNFFLISWAFRKKY
jgi:hypothetical protein